MIRSSLFSILLGLIVFLSSSCELAFSQDVVPLCKSATDLIADGNFGLAADKLTEIRTAMDEQRFANFPDCSIQLIELCKQESSPERRIFLKDWAMNLSPSAPQVELAGLLSAFGRSEYVEGFLTIFSLITKLPNSPLLIIDALVLCVLAGTLIATALFFLWLFLQIFQKFEYLLSRRRYLMLGVVLAAPCLGLHLAILSWGVVVQILYPRKRFVLLCVGILFLVTFFIVPIGITVRAGTSERTEQQLEALWLGNYFEEKDELLARLGVHQDELSKLGMANLLIGKGDFEGARVVLQRLPGKLPIVEERVAKLLLGKAMLGLQSPREAKTYLLEAEALGERSFMLYDSLATASIQLTEINEHEKYFYTANSYANKGLNYLRVRSIDTFYQLKRMTHATYLRASFLTPGKTFEERNDKTFEHLLFSQILFGVIAALTFLIGAYLYFATKGGGVRYAHS